MTDKIRSGWGPLIKDHEMGLVNGGLAGFETIYGNLEFWGKLQRRGTHVNTLKIGSRGDAFCIGGIQRFYAELRREWGWGDIGLVGFGVSGRWSAWDL
jgi:hypothetical protein